jgi:hypothetical protein
MEEDIDMKRKLTVSAIWRLGVAALATPCSAQGVNLPWGQASDMVAWQVLVQVTAPAGIPDSRNAVFETWASDADLFGRAPPQWPAPNAPKKLQASLLALHGRAEPFVVETITPDQCAKPRDPAAGNYPAGACIGEEVRRNWSLFQYFVTNDLYSRSGLARAYASKLAVESPNDAIVVKGDWAPIDDLIRWIPGLHDPANVRRLYHTNSATAPDGSTREYALLGLAISSKQVKQWVWSTFEHRMNPGRCDDIGCNDVFGAVTPAVKPAATPNSDYGPCEKTPELKALMTSGGLDDVWDNYCLKGSQVTFVRAAAGAAAPEPTLLGNSVIERINAGVPIPHSSCITCHSYASFNDKGQPNVKPLQTNPIGAPDPSSMQGFVSADFMWGILGAKN